MTSMRENPLTYSFANTGKILEAYTEYRFLPQLTARIGQFKTMPFVNAEKPQYLVIEDSFPNGRPALEKGFGVYMADRNTVNLSERMKVTVCLNPVHSATGPLGVVPVSYTHLYILQGISPEV